MISTSEQAVDRPPTRAEWRTDLRFRIGTTGLIWAATATLLVAYAIVFPNVLTFGSIATLTPLVGVLIVAALGQALVIATGGIDLSVSSIITLVAITVVYVSEGSNERLPFACLIGVAVGVAVGLINGFLIEFLQLSALVVTMATAQVGLGSATILYSQGVNRQAAPSAVRDLTTGTLFGFSYVLFAGIAVVVFVGILTAGAVLGRRLTAASASMEAARYQGVRVRALRGSSYVAAALLYGACGIALVGIFGTPTVALGAQYQLSAIAAVVLGGMALTGGKLRPAATLAGAIFLAVSNQAVATTGQPVGAQNIAQGVILLTAVLLVSARPLRAWRDRRSARTATQAARETGTPAMVPTKASTS